MTELPTSFGKYYLTEKLATGGMAEIYLAKIIGPGGFEKPVVIKQILPKLSGQRHFVDLFVAEAKTLVTLTHGNIVPVYELGVIEDTYFIAMDYIDGPTLYRLTETMSGREGRMEPAVAAWITARMLEGLDYAHRKGEGVIHRDLSPRNVMLSRDGEVKLVDFGIAVTLGDPGDSTSSESAPTGSFPYMSPEQVRREPLTGQTDLFSAGVLAWEMLTGRRLFARPDADATLAAVQSAEIPRPSTVRPEVPDRLADVVMRALERDRGARWQSAADMLAALNKYLYSLDETPGPRDVAALVARFCPPETRRLPTHLEAAAHEAQSPDAVADEPSAPVAVPAGPSTAVIPRDQQARGKPQRQKSFATNVDLKSILDRATPLVPFDAIDDSAAARPDTLPDARPGMAATQPAPPPRGSRPIDTQPAPPPPGSRPLGTQPAAPPRSSRPLVTVDESAEEPVERPIRRTPRSAQLAAADGDSAADPQVAAGDSAAHARSAAGAGGSAADPRSQSPLAGLDVPRQLRQPPSRFILILAGIGATGLALGSIFAFFQGRDAVLASGDAGLGSDAAVLHAPPVDATSTEPDAPPPEPDAVVPVMVPIDAGPRDLARDAGIRRVTVDAGLDAAPVAKGTAKLQIGADPWGEIYVDGKAEGRTPRELTVTAGRHTIEVVFPAEQPPRKQTFAVDLANGETKPLQADFSH